MRRDLITDIEEVGYICGRDREDGPGLETLEDGCWRPIYVTLISLINSDCVYVFYVWNAMYIKVGMYKEETKHI